MSWKTKLATVCMGFFAGAMAGCSTVGSSGGQKDFVIAYAPNESTEQSADARNGMAKDLEKVLGVRVKEIQASDYNGDPRGDAHEEGGYGVSWAGGHRDGL